MPIDDDAKNSPKKVSADINVQLIPDSVHRNEFSHSEFSGRRYLSVIDFDGIGAYEQIELCDVRGNMSVKREHCVPLEKDNLERALALIRRAVANVMNRNYEDCDYKNEIDLFEEETRK